MNSHWYQMTRDELFTKLKTDENGLTHKEANQRLEKYGKNELPKKKKDSVLKIFFNEFKNPILILLLVAVIASLIGNEPIEALAIILIVLVDVSMGTYQENKANNTAEALAGTSPFTVFLLNTLPLKSITFSCKVAFLYSFNSSERV